MSFILVYYIQINIIDFFCIFQVWGCEGTGLFQAFSHHFLHRLGIPERQETQRKIQITFLARQSQYRRVLNQDELLSALEKNDQFIVRKVSL